MRAWLDNEPEGPLECIPDAPEAGPIPPNEGPLLRFGPLFAASKAALYEEAGANDGIEFCKKGALESGPNEDGEFIEDPNEALNGEWEPLGPCDCEPPLNEPNGNDGEMENVEPPKLNDGAD